MIISLRSLSYSDLLKLLNKSDKIVIWSCNGCVKGLKLGGRAKLSKLADMLKADGFNVIHTELIGMSCVYNLVEKRKIHSATRDIFKEATTIIVLACEDGYDNVKQVFDDKKVIKVTKTVGLGGVSVERGPILTHPFEETGLKPNINGYTMSEVAEKLNLYPTFFDADKPE